MQRKFLVKNGQFAHHLKLVVVSTWDVVLLFSFVVFLSIFIFLHFHLLKNKQQFAQEIKFGDFFSDQKKGNTEKRKGGERCHSCQTFYSLLSIVLFIFFIPSFIHFIIPNSYFSSRCHTNGQAQKSPFHYFSRWCFELKTCLFHQTPLIINYVDDGDLNQKSFGLIWNWCDHKGDFVKNAKTIKKLGSRNFNNLLS